MYLSHINAYILVLLSLQKSPYSPGREEGVWGLEFNNGDVHTVCVQYLMWK